MLRFTSLPALVLLVAVLASALPSAGATEATALPAFDPEFFGMVIRDPAYEFGTDPAQPGQPNRRFMDTMGEVLARTGVRWVRMEFRVEAPLESQDQAWIDSEIAKHDYFVNEVAPRHGFKVLGLLSFALVPWSDPCELNKAGTTHARFGGGVNPYMAAWLTRALRIVDRYGDRVHAYEILNEYNRLPSCGTLAQVAGVTQGLKAVHPKVAGRLITKFYRFCHGFDLPAGEPAHPCSSADIIVGGLHPRGSSPPGTNDAPLTDVQYVQAIYTDPDSFGGFRADQRHPYYPADGVGYHPYPEEIRLSPNNQYVDRGIGRMRQALAAAGDPCVPFWVTEIGYNVGQRVNGVTQTEVGQAEFLYDVYTTLAARRLSPSACASAPEVKNVFWFKYEDFPGPNNGATENWGIARIPWDKSGRYPIDGSPAHLRRSYLTYRELAGLSNPKSFLPGVRR